MMTLDVNWFLYELDLRPIAERVRRQRQDPRWTNTFLDQAELGYRQFLYLCHQYPKTSLVPTSAIDVFWHEHILFTEKYFADCMLMFGCYLHHDPTPGPDDVAYREGVSTTTALFLKHFGGFPAGLVDFDPQSQVGATALCSHPNHGKS